MATTAPWAGTYVVGSQCDVTQCCCITPGSTIQLTQNGAVVSFAAPLSTTAPALAASCSGTQQFTIALANPGSTSASFTLLGVNFVASLSSGGVITVTNSAQPMCSNTASLAGTSPGTRTSGVCRRPSGTHSVRCVAARVAPFPIGAVAGGAAGGALVVLAIVIVVVLLVRRRNRMLQLVRLLRRAFWDSLGRELIGRTHTAGS